MKLKKKNNTLLAIGITSLAYLSSPLAFADEHDHAKEGVAEHADHDDHEGHDHAKVPASPNGGRILTEIEPHAELLVTENRKLQITFLDDEGKKVAVDQQSASAHTGQRSAPVRMTFEVKDGILISDKALPKGMNIPAILQVKITPEAKSLTIRLNLNLENCPTCDYLEYACTCDHTAEDGHEGHDH
ncbi:hypothetical protein [Roseibacillus persicicus]|uniref:Uncharacterized protein n=1 Tax=Roseibacillus persicicus TaxID=454148 RepID=A0A918WJ50_9BACT|nr:hypothetical protein [Roseibacillus persicicus]GHC51246.1 hypothetical protein GCM10007100_16780 [Roseibacillus persicicus]